MSFYLYYAGYNAKTGLEQIGLACSTDLKKWQRISDLPIIPVGSAGECDAAQTSNPCVIKQGEVFKMWYQGKSPKGILSVCYAESSDGVAWRVRSGAVLAPEGVQGYRAGYHQPHVMYDGGKYRMWFVAHAEKCSTFSYAESADGISWHILDEAMLEPVGGWEGERLCYPFVRKTEDGFELWYTGRSQGHTWTIGRGRSSDGFIWQRDVHNPLLPKSRTSVFVRTLADFFAPLRLRLFAGTYGTASPFVFEHDGAMFMFAHDTGGKKRLSMGLYTSPDGLAWTPVKHDILREGSPEWESYFQADPYLLKI